MSASWPAPPFPQTFLLDSGIKRTGKNPVLETEMDAGDPKQRVIETGGWIKYDGKIGLTCDQFATWIQFYEVECTFIGPFTWTDPISRDVYDFTFCDYYEADISKQSHNYVEVTFAVRRKR